MIRAESISKKYGGLTALERTTLDFRAGATTVLIGPSGCGKSTLLRMLLGLVACDAGRIFVAGTELTRDNADRVRHRIGYVIQDGGLFPHLTAERNVALLARFLKRPAAEIDRRIGQLAELVQLDRSLLGRYPVELSGGQRQRIGLMRALMLDPPIVLLDEPLGALDPITRGELQTQLKAIFARLRKTAVLVTHDMGEAAYLGDDIVLMRAGRVVQRGTLADLMERPVESYVTDFIRAQRTPWLSAA